MSRLKDSKNVYDNIPIPDRLEETVASAIEQAAARRKEDHGVPDQPVTEKWNRKKWRRRVWEPLRFTMCLLTSIWQEAVIMGI